VLRLILDGEVTMCLDARISAEYREVLSRPEWPFARQDALEVLEFLVDNALEVMPKRLTIQLPDPDDLMLVEAAVAAPADFIVTGNQRHFPKAKTMGVPVVSPSEFLQLWGEARSY
jgi:uncharacterized protein